jgi:AraC family transcriptional regulator, regulatory protein of adaptative response / methylphosphotriester-DNA alkyltransferase methyltransferase
MTKSPLDTSNIGGRKGELATLYLQALDAHLAELKAGAAETVHSIGYFASQLFVHPVHLSNTIKEVTGQSTCYWFEQKLLQVSKELLTETNLSAALIAARLHYDPSNFSKFFKAYTGTTPKKFRDAYQKN